jgi:hypothetical protein
MDYANKKLPKDFFENLWDEFLGCFDKDILSKKIDHLIDESKYGICQSEFGILIKKLRKNIDNKNLVGVKSSIKKLKKEIGDNFNINSPLNYESFGKKKVFYIADSLEETSVDILKYFFDIEKLKCNDIDLMQGAIDSMDLDKIKYLRDTFNNLNCNIENKSNLYIDENVYNIHSNNLLEYGLLKAMRFCNLKAIKYFLENGGNLKTKLHVKKKKSDFYISSVKFPNDNFLQYGLIKALEKKDLKVIKFLEKQGISFKDEIKLLDSNEVDKLFNNDEVIYKKKEERTILISEKIKELKQLKEKKSARCLCM